MRREDRVADLRAPDRLGRPVETAVPGDGSVGAPDHETRAPGSQIGVGPQPLQLHLEEEVVRAIESRELGGQVHSLQPARLPVVPPGQRLERRLVK